MMEFLSKIDREQEFQFNRSEMWLDLADVDEEFEKTLKPHTEGFTNKLRPMWLFYLKSIQKLDFFDFVLARDGAMGMTRFFSTFPTPKGISTKILMDKVHYRIVPEAWKENIILYSHAVEKSDMDSSSFVLVLNGHEYISNEDQLKEAWREIKNTINPEKLIVIPNEFKIQGLESSSQGASYLSSLVSTISREFSGVIEFVGLSEIAKMSLSGVQYLNLNPGKVMFSESYVDHVLESKGCVRMDAEDKVESTSIQTGLNAYLNIGVPWPADHSAIRNEIEKEFGDNLEDLLQNERLSEEVPVFFNSELHSFSHWVNTL